jgi:hypothetical protein
LDVPKSFRRDPRTRFAALDRPGPTKSSASSRQEDSRRKLSKLSEQQPHLRRRAKEESSKIVHDGEPIVVVPDLRYLIDFITRASDVLSGATQRIGDPIKDSNPLRNRDQHQFGTLIAIPRNPQATKRQVAQINTTPSMRIYPSAGHISA